MQPAKLIARDEAAIGERSETTDFSVNFKSREFSADFQVPEPDGLVIVAQGELSVRGRTSAQTQQLWPSSLACSALVLVSLDRRMRKSWRVNGDMPKSSSIAACDSRRKNGRHDSRECTSKEVLAGSPNSNCVSQGIGETSSITENAGKTTTGQSVTYLGKGEVESSILSCSTIISLRKIST